MTYLIGIDPGAKRTGVAAVHYGGTTAAKVLVTADLEGIPEVWDWLTYDKAPTHAIVEDYIPHRIAGNPKGLEVIGAVKAWAYVNDVPVIVQPASGRKVAVPDEALRNLGIKWSGDKDRNWIEAVRHAVWFLKKQAHVPTLKKGWPDA